jgi:glycosyltransferase involved in cell wall biosynthesis
MQRKKILVLASTFPRWENDTTPPFVFELEKRLAGEFDLYLMAPHCKGAKKYETMENIQVFRFQYFWPAHYQKLCYGSGILPNIKKNKLLTIQGVTLILLQYITALKIIKKEKINLIHAHWIIPQGIIALLIKKQFHIPYIITTHGGDIYGLQNKILIRIKKIILQNAKKITVVSTAIKSEILQKINPNLPIEVISMGVDATLFNPDKYDKTLKEKYNVTGPLFLFVGRFAEKKGVRYLIEAMPEITKQFIDARLLIIGEGTLENELKKLTQKLKLEQNITFIGPLPNNQIPNYYATADIFVGPSIQTQEGDTEGLGLTFVEASLSGCIPIGTDVGGISDVIQNHKTGILVPPKDPQRLADAITYLLKNKSSMQTLKQQARTQTIKTFDWKIIKDKYKQLYIAS